MADQMLAVKLRNKQQKSTIQRAVSGGVNGKLIKVMVEKVNKKLGLAVDGGANTKQKAVIIRQIVVSALCQSQLCQDRPRLCPVGQGKQALDFWSCMPTKTNQPKTLQI